MRAAGIEIKYYNTVPLYRFFSVQHRSHRKLLIIDGQTVLTGGRNIAEDYFDLSTHYNFLDSDLLLKGPLAEKIRSSFDLYWNSAFATDPRSLNEQISPTELQQALAFLKVTDEDSKTLELVRSEGAKDSASLSEHSCNDLIFVTDFPERGEAHRKIFPTILKLISSVEKNVLVESPYFVIRQDGHDALKSLGDRGVSVKVLTNSLYSTDAYYVISALNPRKGWIAETGLDLYAYQGESLKGYPIRPRSERWGIHAKRAVLDDKTVLIGTYNIDPRSANLNSELMVVCRNNPAFARAVTESIQARMQQSDLIISQKEVVNGDALTQRVDWKMKLQTWLAYPLASLFDVLL